MAIDPSDIDPKNIAAIERFAKSSGTSEAELLNSILHSSLSELEAIQQGYDDFKNGRFQDFDEADKEFRLKNGISIDS